MRVSNEIEERIMATPGVIVGASAKMPDAQPAQKKRVSLGERRPSLAEVLLVLPWPPSVNHYWRHVVIGKRAQVYVSKEGRDYRKKVADEAEHLGQVRGRLEVRIVAYPPDQRARDIDNILKCLLDSIVHAGVISDDADIDALTITRGPVRKPASVHVLVRVKE